MMEGRIILVAALIYQVRCQLCVSPGVAPQVVANIPLALPTQVTTTPIVATTIIDNSVSTALANALQLLIVSDILESKLGAGASCLTNWLNLNNVETPCYPRIEVVQPIAEYITPCAAPVEVIAPCRPIIEPYPYLGGCSNPNLGYVPCAPEIVNPYLPNAYLQDFIMPNGNYYNVPEVMAPNFNCYCGFEVVPSCAPICANDIINIPSYNNGYEPIHCGIPEIISPCRQYRGDILNAISPCNSGCFSNVPEFVTPLRPGCGVPEIIPPCSPYYGGYPEVISPIYPPGCAGIPELIPNFYGPCREVVAPCTSIPDVLLPNPCNVGCSGCDFCGPPELLFPPSIPAQLGSCNCGCFGPNFCF